MAYSLVGPVSDSLGIPVADSLVVPSGDSLVVLVGDSLVILVGDSLVIPVGDNLVVPVAKLYEVVLRGGRPHAQRVRWPQAQRVWFIVYIKIKGDFLPSVRPPAGGS